MEQLADFIAEIESRLEADAYVNGDKAVEKRQASAMAFLVPREIRYPDAQALDELLDTTENAPNAHTGSQATPKSNPASYSYSRAINGLSAAAETTAAQYRKTNLSRYSKLMDIVLLELAHIVQKDLDESAAVYRPLTAAFKGSTAELKAAYKSAKSAIDSLNLAASVVSAFGRLVAAV